MSLFRRVAKSPNICDAELDFDGFTIPSTIEGYQPFFNSIPVNSQFQKAYTGKAAVSFKEEPVFSASGTSYKQIVTLRFPSTDRDRATRIDMFRHLKYVKLVLSDGNALIIGRNDFFQNTKPQVDFNSTQTITTVEISAVSISPAGFIPHQGSFQLPAFIPISLLNLN